MGYEPCVFILRILGSYPNRETEKAKAKSRGEQKGAFP